MSYLTKRKILNIAQYGFMKGKSTKGALIRFITKIQKDMDDKNKSTAVYIDLKKAFDTIDHKILLNKLEHYGIRGIANDWFKDYFRNRSQYVYGDETASETMPITCGVPQGSNLGPLLFLIYINDLPKCLQHCTATLFADDTTIYATAKTEKELQDKMNEDLNNLSAWFKANKLTLNTKKTYACDFGKSKQPYDTLRIDGKTIEMTNCVKYLGVYVDSKLSWKPHISYVVNKISTIIGVMSKIRKTLNIESMKTLYYALVHSRLLYCQEAWGTAYKTTLDPLVKAHKKVMRLIIKAKYRAHTKPIYERLKIRPLMSEIQYRRALLAYEIIKDPEEHQVELKLEIKHQHNTRAAQDDLTIPRKNTLGWGTNGIEYVLIKAYNALPKRIKRLGKANKIAYKKRLALLFT